MTLGVGRGLLLALALAPLAAASDDLVPGDLVPGDPRAGQRIYREGLGRDGHALKVLLRGEIELSAAQFPCVSCHRRSGFGGSEGGVYVPPITAPTLFEPWFPDRAELFRALYQELRPDRLEAQLRALSARPAYSEASLGVALAQGRDPDGRALGEVMPRYVLSPQALADLTAYLATLGAGPAPGVEADRIHFATVVAPGADPALRDEMVAALSAFARFRNLETGHTLARRGGSPSYRDDFTRAARRWELHTWDLAGPPASWGAQLAARYAEQPVFALLSGLGGAEWRPVHEFCEEREIPCIFPQAEAPADGFGRPLVGATSLYLSGGLALEGAAIARYLADAAEGQAAGTRRPVLQLLRGGGPGEPAARALRHALAGSRELDEIVLPATGALAPAKLEHALARRRPAVLVAWLGTDDWERLASAVSRLSEPPELILSYRLLGERLPRRPPGVGSLLLTYPYALPGHEDPQIFRSRAWFRSRGLAVSHERRALDLYFTLMVTDHALTHLVDRFSRDLFVESVEAETKASLNPGHYPQLGLGPGQRYAVKGCYLVKLAEAAAGGIEAASTWITP